MSPQQLSQNSDSNVTLLTQGHRDIVMQPQAGAYHTGPRDMAPFPMSGAVLTGETHGW